MSYMEDQIQRQYEAWMEQEYEWHMMSTQLSHEGWSFVKLNKQMDQKTLNDMHEWLRENYYGKYECFNDEFMFANEKDATWFAMRWA